MKKVNTSLFDKLRSTASNISLAWKIVRKDGYTLGFTSSDVEFTLDDLLYEPSNAFSGMAISSKQNLSVDNTSAAVLISDKITEKDLQFGLWEGSRVYMFWVDPFHPELGTVPLRGGIIGELKIKNLQFEAELRSPFQKLQQPYGELYTLECNVRRFGDDMCKVPLDCDTWQASHRYLSKAGADAGIGSYVRPSVQNGFWYQCISAQGEQAELHSFPVIAPSMDSRLQGLFGDPFFNYNGESLESVATSIRMRQDSEAIRLGDLEITSMSDLVHKLMAKALGNTQGVSIEGQDVYNGKYYIEKFDSQGQLVHSEAYLTPTKQGSVPLSAPTGVQPLVLTNVSSQVIYKLGMSGTVEPVWPTVLGSTVSDNQLIWKCVRANKLVGEVTAVISRSGFLDSSRNEPQNWWRYGYLRWLTGANSGLRMEIRSHAHSNGASFALLEAMPGPIAVGDTYELIKGCDKTRTTCKQFDNIHNFRGFPDMPTEEKALATANISSQATANQDDGGS